MAHASKLSEEQILGIEKDTSQMIVEGAKRGEGVPSRAHDLANEAQDLRELADKQAADASNVHRRVQEAKAGKRLY